MVAAGAWASEWTAIGTLALAGATLLLGGVAAVGNRRARQALQVSQAELRASIYPLLEAVPSRREGPRGVSATPLDYTNVGGQDAKRWVSIDDVDIDGKAEGVFVSIPVQNAGNGVARVRNVRPCRFQT